MQHYLTCLFHLVNSLGFLVWGWVLLWGFLWVFLKEHALSTNKSSRELGTSLVAHMDLLSKKSEMEQVCLLSNPVLFANVQELAQEKMLFWWFLLLAVMQESVK